MIENVFVNNKSIHHVPSEFLSIFCDTRALTHTHTRARAHTQTHMRKSQKSSTYLHPKMLKIFFEGTPSRRGCSHLIGHNIYENARVQSKTTW